ncbi:unnamed protein product [Protopolystoma xenopodis]|uniref:Uncharacterized protein n=1 Tax=Protopolystoma xenopodis TaxID=117903 RepID=A0A3S5BGT7_9PLAT|nr:unnamed protein product [Protopolystoma xenopodis]
MPKLTTSYLHLGPGKASWSPSDTWFEETGSEYLFSRVASVFGSRLPHRSVLDQDPSGPSARCTAIHRVLPDLAGIRSTETSGENAPICDGRRSKGPVEFVSMLNLSSSQLKLLLRMVSSLLFH